MGGPIGIRPEAYREIRLALGIKNSDWREMYSDIRVMESAALEEMRKEMNNGR